ncbi:MAG: acyl-CoA carboxylase subunit beta [Yaniella sp.]|nr:acyl-CoA carboxylase subunit beta [Yaniella sp.]
MGVTTPDITTTAGKLEDYFHRREAAVLPTGQGPVDRQHSRGKQTARERIDALLDDDSFVEFDQLRTHRTTAFGMDARHPEGDGVVAGYGTIDGRNVAVFAQDFTVFGGSLSKVNGEKIVKTQEFAATNGFPLIAINDGGGARIQEGVDSLAMFADIFRNNVMASGVVPQISIIMGPAAGGAAYSPALTDFVVMVDQTSHMFITGPDVIKSVTGEEVDMETLGGARQHNETSGTAAYMAADEQDAFDWVSELLDYLPAHNFISQEATFHQDLETTVDDLALDTIIPDSANQPYDMLDVIATIVDDGALLQVQERYAPNIIVGLGRIEGRTVGVVANQPSQLAGTLDIAASEKAARFVRFCDAFNIPIVTLVDVPGFLPGVDQEHSGIIRRGAKLIYAYAEATVPKITIITRKAFGGAYIVMGSKKLGADLNLAWPTAQIGVMGAQGAVNILYRRDLIATEEAGDDVEARRAELIEDYETALLNPYEAADSGYIDAVIAPSETRAQVVRALRATAAKRQSRPAKKHGNIPL